VTVHPQKKSRVGNLTAVKCTKCADLKYFYGLQEIRYVNIMYIIVEIFEKWEDISMN
jgi:hypothetical protein